MLPLLILLNFLCVEQGNLWFLVPYLFFFGLADGIFTLYLTEWSMALLKNLSITQILLGGVAISKYGTSLWKGNR